MVEVSSTVAVGDQSNLRAGASIAAVGDVNNDGFQDFLIGFDNETTPAVVVFGTTDGTLPPLVDPAAITPDRGFLLTQSGDDSGTIRQFAVGVGDVNGDGIDDFVFGIPGLRDDGAYLAGIAFLVFGRDSTAGDGFGASIDLTNAGPDEVARFVGDPNDLTGQALAGGGDFNGDGINDFVVSTPQARVGSANNVGEIYVIFGVDSTQGGSFPNQIEIDELAADAALRISGEQSGLPGSGSSIALGDVNGDEIPDLIIGGTGGLDDESYVIFGGRGGGQIDLTAGVLQPSDGIRIDGADDSRNLGRAVAYLGDVNGDGVGDIALSAFTQTEGRVYVLYGKSDGSFGVGLDLDALSAADGFVVEGLGRTAEHGSLAGGDFNGDGIGDLIIGDPYGGDDAAGRVYVIFGLGDNRTTDAPIDVATLSATEALVFRATDFSADGADRSTSDPFFGDEPDREGFGNQVISLFDFNGDGAMDIGISAPRAEAPTGTAEEGFATIIFGSASVAPPEDDQDPGGDGGGSGGGDDGASNGDDTLVGGADDDSINAAGGDDLVRGGAGDDMLQGGAGDDTILGGGGGDLLQGDDGADELRGGSDADSISGGGGADQLFGQGGSDTVQGGAGDDSLNGNIGDDTLSGGSGADTLNGGAGGDFLAGGGGDDLGRGGTGDDMLRGDGGSDTLRGGAGDDTLSGGGGGDSVIGGGGDDQILGGSGNDSLQGGGGSDTMQGGVGNDVLAGQQGDDAVRGGSGNDVLRGGAGNDTLAGGGDDDVLGGGAGGDLLRGGSGNDVLRGGGGDDTISAGPGQNTVVGGDGSDTILFRGGLATYEVAFGDGGLTFSDGDETTTVLGVETFVFGGQTLTLLQLLAAIGDTISDPVEPSGGPDGIDGLDPFAGSANLIAAENIF